MDITYHYPPELFNLLVDTIPLLNRSKKEVILFFKGAGIGGECLKDIEDRVDKDRDNINKYEIVRTILQRLNEGGEASIRERRELLKRVTQFESFSACWQSDQLKAKGLVAEIRNVINVKDSFTRMKQEREIEMQKHQELHLLKQKEIIEKSNQFYQIKTDMYSLFSLTDSQKRGFSLEKVLNNLFNYNGILIRDSFRLMQEEKNGIVEQVDGVVEIDGELYFVEIKWTKDLTDVNDISRHLVRVYHRGYSRAIFISCSGYTSAALATCKEALQKTVIILCTLEEIVHLLEAENDLKEFLKKKRNAAIIDKNPFITK